MLYQGNFDVKNLYIDKCSYFMVKLSYTMQSALRLVVYTTKYGECYE